MTETSGKPDKAFNEAFRRLSYFISAVNRECEDQAGIISPREVFAAVIGGSRVAAEVKTTVDASASGYTWRDAFSDVETLIDLAGKDINTNSPQQLWQRIVDLMNSVTMGLSDLGLQLMLTRIAAMAVVRAMESAVTVPKQSSGTE